MRYKDIYEFFQRMNELGKYVVLRNFEGLPESISTEEHPDIDILCEDATLFAKNLGLHNRGNYKDNIHFCVSIDCSDVSLDLREPGDGYLDTAWEYHILEFRDYQKGMFYTPSIEDFFYSLLYHVKVQKNHIKEEYKNKLCEMSMDLNVLLNLEDYSTLDNFMRCNGYKYTYPRYLAGTFIVKNADQDLVEKSTKRIIRSIYKGYLRFKRLLIWVKSLEI